MSFVHGKGTVVSIDTNDLSAFSNSVTFTRTADSHDTTTFGKNAHVYQVGLTDGTATIEGIYDNTEMTGPGASLRPLLGAAAVPMAYEPEGTGPTMPLATVDVIVTSYEESSPVADMITWTCELQFSDEIADTVSA